MPEKSDTSLSNSEWLIMECLWAKAPLTVTQIVKATGKQTGWSKSILTIDLAETLIPWSRNSISDMCSALAPLYNPLANETIRSLISLEMVCLGVRG